MQKSTYTVKCFFYMPATVLTGSVFSFCSVYVLTGMMSDLKAAFAFEQKNIFWEDESILQKSNKGLSVGWILGDMLSVLRKGDFRKWVLAIQNNCNQTTLNHIEIHQINASKWSGLSQWVKPLCQIKKVAGLQLSRIITSL